MGLQDVNQVVADEPEKTVRHQIMATDRHVSTRMRDRRIFLKLTQQQLGSLIGASNSQVHKYENGIDRITIGRLLRIAQALGVSIEYFFEGLSMNDTFRPTSQQRQLLELARNFFNIPSRRHQESLCALARALAG